MTNETTGLDIYLQAKLYCTSDLQRLALELYVEWQNDYLSISTMSEHKGGDDDAHKNALQAMIDLGRSIWKEASYSMSQSQS